jgi:glucose-1-phosphate adenylyltransferase
VIDKEVVIGKGAVVGYGEDNTPNRDEPKILYTGITLVGKRAMVPVGLRIGRNCKIMPGAVDSDFPSIESIHSGSTVEAAVKPPPT